MSERDGEINHDVALMRGQSKYPVRLIKHPNVIERFNGFIPPRVFRTTLKVESQYGESESY